MKYKVGDKVRIVEKWPADGSAHQEPGGRMDKWLGQVMTIREVCDGYYRMREDQSECGGWYWWPNGIAGPALEFKVGDRVIGNAKADYAITRQGWHGIVTRVTDEGRIECRSLDAPVDCIFRNLRPECFDLVDDAKKIIVTTDGKTTTAKLFAGKELLKSAEAKCAPADTFDFEKGAAIAVDRLLGHEEKEELFPLEDIKAGYLIVVRSTKKDETFNMTVIPGLTLDEEELGCVCPKKEWWPLSNFDAKLVSKSGRYSIEAVYGYCHNMYLLDNTTEDRKLLWSRAKS